MTDHRSADFGYSNGVRPFAEGYVRKGGVNPPLKETVRRPPPPAPMRAFSPTADGVDAVSTGTLPSR
jgi:hypothetical protein